MEKIKNYKPYVFGKITRFEAGVIYRVLKEEHISVLPETTSTLYDEADSYFSCYSNRYSNDRDYFDKIYNATEYILKEEYEKAQEQLNLWQNYMISHAGKKSIFYKYSK